MGVTLRQSLLAWLYLFDKIQKRNSVPTELRPKKNHD